MLGCRLHLHRTPFVPSPLVPSPPRSKTSEDDLPIKLPAQEQGLASQCEHQRKPLINVCVFFPVFFLPHRWPGTITFAITSPHTALPHAPPPILHLALPRPHLLQHRIHALRAHRCRSHRAPAPLSRHIAQPATEPSIPASSRLVLRSPKLPWVVAVGPIGSPPTFFIGKGDGSARRRARRRSRTSPCSRRALEYLPTRHYLQ